MKKTLLVAVAVSAATVLSAQSGEITSNRGENWLSESGDWGVTIDANPFLNYAGNLFNGTQNNTFGGFNWANNSFAIQGKKLIDSETAYRGMLRIGFGSEKDTRKVNDVTDTDPTDGITQVEDVHTMSFSGITVGAGLEKRIGSTRIVGVYGGMFTVSVGSMKDAYEYGNAVTFTNQLNANQFGAADGTTEVKQGGTFGLGLMAFGGVEWFAAPKVSISGEYSWGLSMDNTGFGETTSEQWVGDATTGSVDTEVAEGGVKENDFSLDTGISGINIGVNFYFQ